MKEVAEQDGSRFHHGKFRVSAQMFRLLNEAGPSTFPVPHAYRSLMRKSLVLDISQSRS